MLKNPASQSGLFHPRSLFAFALCSVGVLLGMFSFASTPPVDATRANNIKQPAASEDADPNCSVVSGLNDKCAAWVSVYDNPNGHTVSNHGLDRAVGLAVSPNGDRMYVTGASNGRGADASTESNAVATVAYDTTTGTQQWVSRYDSGANSFSEETAGLALTRDGSRLYILATSNGVPVSEPGATNVTNAFTVVAYDTATGTQLWVAQHLVPFDPNSIMLGVATAIAVSPDGTRVFVTGETGKFNLSDSTTIQVVTAVAFDSSGQKLWSTSDGGPFNAAGLPAAIRSSPDGDRVYLTDWVCRNEPVANHCDGEWATFAYDATSGTRLWASYYATATGSALPTTLEVSPGGDRIYVSGNSCAALDAGGNCLNQSTTIAYDAAGTQQWVAVYPGPQGAGITLKLALNPTGDRLFATGWTCLTPAQGNICDANFATIAYDATSGTQLWEQNYGFAGYPFGGAINVVVGPDGQNVYVGGISSTVGAVNTNYGTVSYVISANPIDYVALSYSADTGTQRWVARYNSSPGRADGDVQVAMGISPDGSRLFVTGTQTYAGVAAGPLQNQYDFGTVAYDTGLVPLTGIVSRKVHGDAGQFDINLPLAGPHAIECRSGGTNGNHTIIFSFANTLTSVGSASVTSGTGSVGSSNIDGNDAHQYIVNLTGVTNAQTITISLTNVSDSAGNSSGVLSASMGVLVGDVNASGVVTTGDTNLCKAQALQPVTIDNFRNDINASGSVTTGDVNIIKQNALSQL
jgi:hypothetical protein